MHYYSHSTTLIVGPMKSGKSKELFNFIDFLQTKKVSFIIFKPNIDKRTIDTITSRFMSQKIKSITIDVKNTSDILKHVNLKNIKLPFAVIIDEVQFFGNEIVSVVKELNIHGIACYIAGLDTDAKQNTFGPVGDLLAIADDVIKTKAVCQICNGISTKTILSNEVPNFEKNNILIEADASFLSVCNRCCYKK